MDHMADKYFSESQKAFKKSGKHLKFEDMMEFIRDWIMVLQSKGVSYNHQSAKLAALELETPAEQGGQRPHSSQSKQGLKNGGPSWARRVSPTRSPPKVQPKCGICAKYHETAQCLKLAPMSAEERARELMRKRICFACLQPGHRRLECPQSPPVCMHCGEDHNTILHKKRVDDTRQTTQRPLEGPRAGGSETAEHAAVKTLAPIPLMSNPPLAAQTPAGGLSGSGDTI